MKKNLFLLLILFFSACSNQTTHTIKEISLTQEKALSYFFYTEGLDNEINEPLAEVESDLYSSFLGSKEKFLLLKDLKKSNILTKTNSYTLILFSLDGDAFAGTFAPDGTAINFILLEKSFGTNEFSIQRTYKQLSQNTFSVIDERYDVEWIVHPTKGISKLTRKSVLLISLTTEGYFNK